MMFMHLKKIALYFPYPIVLLVYMKDGSKSFPKVTGTQVRITPGPKTCFGFNSHVTQLTLNYLSFPGIAGSNPTRAEKLTSL